MKKFNETGKEVEGPPIDLDSDFINKWYRDNTEEMAWKECQKTMKKGRG